VYDLTTPSGQALAGMLARFAEFERDILRERVRAEIAQARKAGKTHGRLTTVAKRTDCISVSRPRRSRAYCNRSNLHPDRLRYINNTAKKPETKIFAIAALFD
jgi:DNA invertase Pin-like site-specific DNA recombinase